MGTIMDGLQQQINELNDKFNRLHQMLEQVSQQIPTLAKPSKISANTNQKSFDCVSPLIPNRNTEPLTTDKLLKLGVKHKDILSDDRENQSAISPEGEIILSRDLQVRRLTAQLTAAYNRIAALEEQLLAYRRSGLSFIKVAHSKD